MSRIRVLCVVVGLIAFVQAIAAAAVIAAPQLRLYAAANSTAVPGTTVDYYLNVVNTGDETTSGELTLVADLPAGVTAESSDPQSAWACPTLVSGDSTVTCSLPEALDPRSFPGSVYSRSLVLRTEVDPSASGIATATFKASGGGAAAVGAAAALRLTAETPAFGIDSFDGEVMAGPEPAIQPDPENPADPANFAESYTQAGGHPFALSTTLSFNTLSNPNPLLGGTWPVEPAKDISVDLPPGFIGNPSATGEFKCTQVKLANSEATSAKPLCPAGSQVGVVTVMTSFGQILGDPLPLFNVVPPPDVPGRFGFNLAGNVVLLDGTLRSGGDFGISVDVKDIPEGLATAMTNVTFWGVPADPSHDAERSCPGESAPWASGPTCTSEAPQKAFFRMPTSCSGPQKTALRFDSWFHPGALDAEGNPISADPNWKTASFLSHQTPGYPLPASEWGPPVGNTGCKDVPFEPTITARTTNHQADSPTGLNVDLTMPQSDDPDAISQADVKTARTTLPEGMTVNPAAASGLLGCSQQDVGLDNSQDPSCPDASKIGSVEIISPDLEEPLEGAIYQAKQFDDPSHSLLAFYTVAKGPGLIVKLAAHVERNPNTGQLTTVFDDNPQLPFERYSLRFDSGPKAPLINPPTCGTHTMQATFTSWARPEEAVKRQSSFQITSGPNGSPCPSVPAPFAPKLSGGSLNPIAGEASPFVLRLTREDGEQRFAGLSVSPPEGLSAYLKGVPYCPEAALAAVSSAPGSGAAQLASPSCPAASQVGTVLAGTGAGPLPFYVNTGKAYLSGPYKGAPLSLAIIVPAVAGPLDLGSVLTRAAIYVDPATAKLNVVSDPLPQMIEGIPLSVRDLRVAIDRPHFALNPTDCSPMSLDARVTGSDGAIANPTEHFQVAECARLGFKPKLSFRLKGGMKRGDNPAFTAILKARAGDANIAKAQVTLPHSAFLAQEHIRTICTRVQYAAHSCPKGSIYGYARAFTPLLDKPLEGPVYLRSSNHPLPDLIASLGGQIQVELSGRIDSVKERIRNTFTVVPDAPVTKFVLTMQGGRKGLIVNSRDLCARPSRATVLLDGQNGKVADSRVVVGARCGGKS